MSPRFLLTGVVFILGASPVSAADLRVSAQDLPRTPPVDAAAAAAQFVVRPGFHAELMAAELDVVDPVAIAFDEDGRLFVVEMRGYSERREENLGRVRLLEDRDGDGQYEKATVFAEGLGWATGVTCWDGGVFVLATPDLLYFKDTDGDGIADVHALIATGFGEGMKKLNVQALPNSLQWGPDQRIHGALGGNPATLRNFARSSEPPLLLRGRDFSFDPRDLKLRAEAGGGQWGMSFDDAGRKFVCSNSRHLLQILHDARAPDAGLPLPPAAVDIAIDGPQAAVFRISPEEPWRQIRTRWRVSGSASGPIEGGGRASGYFTGACGVTIYRGDAYPADFAGNAFIADSGSNLIHRKTLTGGVPHTAQRHPSEKQSEFVASRDNWCRLVSLANAPDGCLWACDMYREVIEHPWSLPEPLKSMLDLNAGNDRGRLWRIVPDGHRQRLAPKLGEKSSPELVALLAHPNGWHRDTAARLLHQRSDLSIVESLRKLLHESESAIGRTTALRVWQGIGAVDDESLVAALRDPAVEVRVQAIRTIGPPLAPLVGIALTDLARDSSEFVRYELAWALARVEAADEPGAVLTMVRQDSGNPWSRLALRSAGADHASALFSTCAENPDAALAAYALDLAEVIGASGDDAQIDAVIEMAIQTDHPAEWLQPLSDGLARTGKTLRSDRLAPAVSAAEERIRAGRNGKLEDFALLALAGSGSSASVISTALRSGLPDGLATGAIDALGRLAPSGLGKTLTDLWPQLSSATRTAALRLWHSRPSEIEALLDAVEAGTVTRPELPAEDLAALRRSNQPAVRERARALFGDDTSRDEALVAFRPALEMTGRAVEGAAIFSTRCASCHRLRGDGNEVGPGLDAVANGGREKLLANIIEPSREITAGYAAGEVETKAGGSFAGVIMAETESTVTLKMPGGTLRNFSRLELARFDHWSRSLMPDGIEAGLTPQAMADLLAFLTGG